MTSLEGQRSRAAQKTRYNSVKKRYHVDDGLEDRRLEGGSGFLAVAVEVELGREDVLVGADSGHVEEEQIGAQRSCEPTKTKTVDQPMPRKTPTKWRTTTFVGETADDGGVVRIGGARDAVVVGDAVVQVEHVLRRIAAHHGRLAAGLAAVRRHAKHLLSVKKNKHEVGHDPIGGLQTRAILMSCSIAGVG